MICSHGDCGEPLDPELADCEDGSPMHPVCRAFTNATATVERIRLYLAAEGDR